MKTPKLENQGLVSSSRYSSLGGYDEFVDVLKGFAIMLVVIGHSGFLYSNIIYLFHMALFFVLSGYCYKHKKVSLFQWTKHKLRTLWVPHFVSIIIVSLLTDILSNLHLVPQDEFARFTWLNFGKAILKAFFFGGMRQLNGGQLIGVNWFLRCLFMGLFTYEIIQRILDRIGVPRRIMCLLIGFVLLTFGWIATDTIGYGTVLNFLCVPILIEIGRCAKDYEMINRIRKQMDDSICIVIVAMCLLNLTLLSRVGSIGMNRNMIVNPLYFIVCSVVGFLFSVCVCNILINFSPITESVLVYMGKNSLWIMLLHFVSFKIVTFIQILYYHDAIENLVAYPIYRATGGWWIAYSIVGILIPCLFIQIKDILSRGNLVKMFR